MQPRGHPRNGALVNRARRVIQNLIASGYSASASGLYDKIVVGRAFRLFGGELARALASQGARAIEIAGHQPVLDMPVGTGHFTLQWAGAHPGVVAGVDIARGMVEVARRGAMRKDLSNFSAVQADAHRLPFASEAFGAVLCTNGLQVIPDPEPAVRELARVMAPSGVLFLSVITVPLGALVPPAIARHMPPFLIARRDVENMLQEAGLELRAFARQRAAMLMEAGKPAARVSSVRKAGAPSRCS
ncbi:MAG: methyltransferase domain-containing protein [Actinobacteria bacterium]|nr:methyltransferase domain-containing protein [Actinomycetota bacterium]